MTRIDGHLSHRGRGLMLLGCVWILFGTSILVVGEPDTLGPWGHLPSVARGCIWLATGVCAVGFGLWGAGRARSKWAFVALVVPSALRAASYLVALGLAAVDHPPYPDYAALVGAVTWVLITAFVLHEASTPVFPASMKRARRQ